MVLDKMKTNGDFCLNFILKDLGRYLKKKKKKGNKGAWCLFIYFPFPNFG